MKKIYIYAGLGLLFAACSTDAIMNEPIETNKIETNKIETNKIEQTRHSDILLDLMATIDKSCLQTSYKDEEELLRYVETIAFSQTAFASLFKDDYRKLPVEELLYLASTDVEGLLKGMNYSDKMKDYLYKQFVTQGAWEISFLIDGMVSVEEQNLLVILGNLEGDEEWNIKKIAFAYGYQTSKANAVILAVAVGQLNKIEKR